MSLRLIEAERAQHPVSLLCSVAGVSRGGYYAWRSRGRSARELRDGELAALTRRVFDDSGGTYGAPRIQAELLAGRETAVRATGLWHVPASLMSGGLDR